MREPPSMNNEPSQPPPAQHPKAPGHRYPNYGYGYGYGYGEGYGGYPGYGPGDGDADSISPLKIQRFFRFLRTYWWVPVLTTLLLVGGALSYNFSRPPTYSSVARMWETEKLSLPQSGGFMGDAATYYGTQVELLRSPTMQALALRRLQASGTNAIPVGDDGKSLKVKLHITQAPKSSVFAIEAFCSNPEYAQAFLDAVTLEYVGTGRKSASRFLAAPTRPSRTRRRGWRRN